MKSITPHRFNAARRGFTIIELIVTLSILLVMLGLINFIFRDTQRAVSLGIETGETIGAQRGIASQIRRDFVEMVGPHQGTVPESDQGGGFLVLTQKLITDDNDNGVRENGEGLSITLPTNNSGANSGSTTETRLVRSDQIGFIRNRGTDQPVGPRTSDEFTSRRVPDDNRIVQFARVWYGHALRTQDSGEAPATNALLGGADSGNDNPMDWLLARQSVFLDETIVNPAGTGAAGSPGGIFATGLTPTSSVIGTSGLPSTVSAQLSNGLTDFAFLGFELKAENSLTHANGALVGDNGTTALLQALSGSPPPAEETAYETAAIINATYAPRRLLANATPANDYETWQIAQAHAILNEGCSDFAIEFAADMYGGTGDNEALLTPGTFAPDGQIDLDELGNIAWYGWAALEDSDLFPERGPRVFPPADNYPPIVSSFTPGPNASAAFVWRHDRFDAGVYSINASADPWSRTTSSTDTPLNPTNAGNAFCDWPYLIRIRYRLHDPKGQIASGAPLFQDLNNNGVQDSGEPVIDSRNGLWFEQIIPVNRPLPVRTP